MYLTHEELSQYQNLLSRYAKLSGEERKQLDTLVAKNNNAEAQRADFIKQLIPQLQQYKIRPEELFAHVKSSSGSASRSGPKGAKRSPEPQFNVNGTDFFWAGRANMGPELKAIFDQFKSGASMKALFKTSDKLIVSRQMARLERETKQKASDTQLSDLGISRADLSKLAK